MENWNGVRIAKRALKSWEDTEKVCVNWDEHTTWELWISILFGNLIEHYILGDSISALRDCAKEVGEEATVDRLIDWSIDR